MSIVGIVDLDRETDKIESVEMPCLRTYLELAAICMNKSARDPGSSLFLGMTSLLGSSFEGLGLLSLLFVKVPLRGKAL